METPEMTIPKPWQNTLHAGITREIVDGKEVDAILWYCSCGEYKTAWRVGVEAMKLAQHAGEHMDTHPKPPLSVVQLGDKSFVMVFEVPGPSEDHPAHMTISVSEDVFMDNRKLATHIGPIGSNMHFNYQKSWQDHEAGEHGLPMMPISVMKIDREGNISPLQMADGLQQVLDLLRSRHEEDNTLPVVGGPASFQHDSEQQWTGFLNSPPVLRFQQVPVDYTEAGVISSETEGLHPDTRWTEQMVGDILKQAATDMGVQTEHFDFGEDLRPADFSDSEDNPDAETAKEG